MLTRWTSRQHFFWSVRNVTIVTLFLTVIAVLHNYSRSTNLLWSSNDLNLTRLLYGDEINTPLFPKPHLIKRGLPVFKKKNFTIWNDDLKSSPVQDLQHFLAPFGVDVRRCDPLFNAQCRKTEDIKVINQSTVEDMDDDVIGDFYQAHKDDPELSSADAFVCFDPPAVCEFFLPFNRSLLVIASTRYSTGRPEEMRWHQWNWRLARIARSPRNLVAANNLYDVEYMKFYSGLEPELIPSFCGYTNAVYRPTSNSSFLLYAGRTPSTKHNAYFAAQWTETCSKMNCSGLAVRHFSEAFDVGYSHEKAASFKGVIHIPDEVSTMSLFEQYRMGIPVFAPSIDLLVTLDHQFDFVKRRNCQDPLKCDVNHASIPRHPSAEGRPDPHDKTDRDAIKYWLKFADFYQFPHVIYFDSILDLILKMKSTNYDEVSREMRRYNQQLESLLLLKWTTILSRIASYQ